MADDVQLTPELITLGHDLLAFKRYYVGMAALLAYDYCLTIGQELEDIWKGKRSPIFYLYVMLISPLCGHLRCEYRPSLRARSVQCSVSCDRFAIVKWFQTLLIVIPAETVLVFRFVMAFLVSTMIVQCCVVFYAMSRPGKNRALETPDHLADAYHICILFSEPKMDTAYLGVSILFDFTVFLLTILRTINFRTKKLPKTALLQTILRDGALYFAVILSGNIVWMVCALIGRRGIKLINAQPSMILTSIMITRLTLSLRSAGHFSGTALQYEWPKELATTTEEGELDGRPVRNYTHGSNPLGMGVVRPFSVQMQPYRIKKSDEPLSTP
ncbi:hypothetical protein NLJ89_g802 [Agrocybe chaxingu]|uniref:DUF6533 domain-containing protein n=1 Tax=Agrocybe chaxingu TaxID=84603 RepID=A0A9W8TEI8_9AGAR|nr:hypothetical protein NLJ89_g802 [Agrocybe chaxingu]